MVILLTSMTYIISFIITFKYLREININDDNNNSINTTNNYISTHSINDDNKNIEMVVSPIITDNHNNSNDIKREYEDMKKTLNIVTKELHELKEKHIKEECHEI
jgi:hypothetical protein